MLRCDVLSWAGLSCRGGRWPDRHSIIRRREGRCLVTQRAFRAPEPWPSAGPAMAQQSVQRLAALWRNVRSCTEFMPEDGKRSSYKAGSVGQRRSRRAKMVGTLPTTLLRDAYTFANVVPCHLDAIMPCSARLGVVPARHPRPPTTHSARAHSARLATTNSNSIAAARCNYR